MSNAQIDKEFREFASEYGRWSVTGEGYDDVVNAYKKVENVASSSGQGYQMDVAEKAAIFNAKPNVENYANLTDALKKANNKPGSRVKMDFGDR